MLCAFLKSVAVEEFGCGVAVFLYIYFFYRMGCALWVLAVVWAGSIVQVVQTQSTARSPDYGLDNHLNKSYVEMLESHDGRPPWNLDVIIVYLLEVVCTKFAVQNIDEKARTSSITKGTLEMYVKVKTGDCVPPPLWKETHHHGECLTEEEAREIAVKELVFTMYNLAAISMEAMTETRLQFYKEKDSEDFVLFLAGQVDKAWKEFLQSFSMPLASVMSSVYRFRDILRLRYTKGRGSSTRLVRAADDIYKVLNSVLIVIVNEGHNIMRRALTAVLENYISFTGMFSQNYNRILVNSLERDNKDSVYPSISRYWDARAMDYAVTRLFRLKTSKGGDAYEIDDLLANILKKHLAGDIKAAMILAKRGLIETKNLLKLNPLDGRLPSIKLPLLGSVPLPATLQDLNLMGVPTTLHEVEELAYEAVVRRYLRGLGKGEMAEFLLGSSW